MEYKINNKDYLDLWKYYLDKAISVKGAMFNTLTWIIGFAAAILGLLFSKLSDSYPCDAKIPLPCFIMLLSFAGILICIYAWVAFYESIKQIRKHWRRADRCKKNITGLDTIVIKNRQSMGIFIPIGIVIMMFSLIFAFVFFFGCNYLKQGITNCW